MRIYTIGFTQKTAKEFFELLEKNKVEIVVDVRLNNKSQLAGFSKSVDLKYFLSAIGGIDYKHEPMFAPSQEILDDYKKKIIDWSEYYKKFTSLLEDRQLKEYVIENYADKNSICFLCSEHMATKCHRTIIADMFKTMIENVEIINLY